MKRILLECCAFIAASLAGTLGLASTAGATVISYSLTSEGAGAWLYTFDVNNNSAAAAIQEFTIFFNDASVASVASGTSQPSDWASPTVFQPNPALGGTLSAYGAFDTISSSGAGIGVGADLGGFTALVTFAAGGTPGNDAFQVFDASFNYSNPLDSGTTQLVQPNGGGGQVPEPGTLGLMALGGLMLVRRAAMRWVNRAHDSDEALD